MLLHLVAKCDFCEQMLSFCKDEKGAKDKDRIKGKYMIFNNCVIKCVSWEKTKKKQRVWLINKI